MTTIEYQKILTQLKEAEERINVTVASLIGHHLQQELLRIINMDIVRPLVLSGLTKHLSHLELMADDAHAVANIPLGSEVNNDFLEGEEPAGTLLTGISPYEIMSKAANRIASVKAERQDVPLFTLRPVMKDQKK